MQLLSVLRLDSATTNYSQKLVQL